MIQQDLTDEIPQHENKNSDDLFVNGLSQADVDSVYACAYELYEKGRLDDAENLFRLLFMYDCKNPDYIIGLGAVFQLKKNYMAACGMYSLAFALDSTQIQSVFYSAQCFLALGEFKSACDSFKYIMENTVDENLKKKAGDYFEYIQANLI